MWSVTVTWRVAQGVHAGDLYSQLYSYNPGMLDGRDVAVVASSDDFRIVELGICPPEPSKGSLPDCWRNWDIDFHLLDTAARPGRDEHRAIASNDVASEEIETVDAHNKSRPAESVSALE